MDTDRRTFLGTVGAALASTWVGSAAGSDEPSDIEVIENIWIPVGSIKLAARLFLPKGGAAPCGAVLEYLPYRKRDSYRVMDDDIGPYLARHGIAFIRVDIRGTGDSDGWIDDEYSNQERSDCLVVIDWISRQRWCNGRVGMRGISYGGFTALQAASARPEPLKAIITACATEQRFEEDVHARGGALMGDNFIWGTLFRGILASPPDPDIVGRSWKQMWEERLRHQVPLASKWTQHRRSGSLWNEGSLQDYGAITCAVYAVGGVVDAYTNAIPRLLERLSCPRKGLITAAGHAWPEHADPGPGLDWKSEEVRWWDHWLNQHESGVMSAPTLVVWMHEAPASAVYPEDVPGQWIAAASTSLPNRAIKHLHLQSGALTEVHAPAAGVATYRSVQTVGAAYPYSCPTHIPVELPRLQNEDDARSLSFDGPALQEALQVLGRPTLRLRIASDAPVAKIVARLCELDQDGNAWIVSHGILNLTHRESSADPSPLVPGEFYDVEIVLNFLAQAIRPGSRLRLSLSESLFPYLWSSPSTVDFLIDMSKSTLELPLRHPSEVAISPQPTTIRNANLDNALARQVALGDGVRITGNTGTDVATLLTSDEWDRQALPSTGTWISSASPIMASIQADDPLSAEFEMTAASRFGFRGHVAEVNARTKVHSDATHFFVGESLTASVDGETVFSRKWNETVRRDLV